MGAKAAPPPHLMSVGMVASKKAAAPLAPPVAAPTNTAKPAEDSDVVLMMEQASIIEGEKPASGRKRAAKKAPRAKAAKTAASAEATPAAAKRARPARKKTAAKSGAGSSNS
jgi:hypothetical protein